MKLNVLIDGVMYKCEPKDAGGTSVDEVSDRFYNAISDMTSIKFKVASGDYIVLGKDAVQRAHFIFKE